MRLFIPATLCLALGGCLSIGGKPQQSSTRFFVLGKAEDGVAMRQENFVPECVIAIAAVSIPGHLDRPQIVMQEGGRMSVLNSFRWGEPLSGAIGGVLRRAIEKQLPQDLVVCAPWDCTVKPYFVLGPAVDDLIIAERSVRIRARCEFWDCGCRQLLGVKRYDSAAPLRGKGVDEAVFAVERLLGEFGDSIGEDLRRMQAGELGILSEKPSNCYGASSASDAGGVDSEPAAAVGDGDRRRPMAAHREIAIEAKADSYVTVDDLRSGKRIFSSRMRAGQVRNVQRDGPVCVSSSNGEAVLVCGKSVEKFNCGEF
jgi:uncharacterized lipoprotein YmbA